MVLRLKRRGRHLVIICDAPVSAAGQNVGGTHAVIAFLRDELLKLGITITIISADLYGRVPAGKTVYDHLVDVLDGLDFDMIHIATQTRLGFLARRYCALRRLAFTTAYHTKYPEFLKVRFGYPVGPVYAYLRWFHNLAIHMIVPTPSMASLLTDKYGFTKAVSCFHGVDTELFKPGDRTFLDHLPRPIVLSVGRIVPEKNLPWVLGAAVPGSKVVVGDGPDSYVAMLKARFPEVHFVGVRRGEDLAKYYRASDVLAIGSAEETFGLTALEAMASGLGVAARRVIAMVDVVCDSSVGCLDEDAPTAIMTALRCKPEDCREYALKHRWPEAARRFFELQVLARPEPGEAEEADAFSLTASGLQMSGIAPLINRYAMQGLEWVVTKAQKKLFGAERR
jgi:glycosyltransferase involved in cell wall biosynthesis